MIKFKKEYTWRWFLMSWLVGMIYSINLWDNGMTEKFIDLSF